MKLPTGVQVGVIIAAFALAGGWIKSCQDAAEARGRFARQIEDAEAMGRAFADSVADLHLHDSLRGIVVDSLLAAERVAKDRAAQFRRIANRARTDTVLRMVPETVRVELVAIMDTLRAAEHECQRALSACDERADSLTAGWVAALLVVQQAESLNVVNERLIGDLHGQVGKGRFGVTDALPWALVAGLAVVLIVK